MYHVMLIQPKIMVMTSNMKKFGTTIEAMIITIYKNGILLSLFIP